MGMEITPNGVVFSIDIDEIQRGLQSREKLRNPEALKKERQDQEGGDQKPRTSSNAEDFRFLDKGRLLDIVA